MKILYIIPYFYPATQFGGPVKQLWTQARKMVSLGMDVSVLTTHAGIDSSVPADIWCEQEGLRVYYSSTGLFGQYTPYYCPAIKMEMERSIEKADIVHLNVSFTVLNYWAYKFCRQFNKPYVYSPHGCLDPVRLAEKKFAKKCFKKLFENRILKNAAKIISLNKQEARHVGAYMGGDSFPGETIPNGIIFDDMPQSRAEGRVGVIKQYKLPEDAVIILYMSRLHSIKGLDLLMESFAKARQKNDKMHLIFAGQDQGGKGIVEDSAKKLKLSDFYYFAGHVDGQQKKNLFEAADIFTLTSYAEGLPCSVLEAMSYSLPIIITHACNVPEVASFDAGSVCAADSDEISHALVELAASKEKRDEQGSNAYRCVRQCYSMDAVIQSLNDCYEKLI